MTSVSWEDEEETTPSAVQWKGRTLMNFVVGRSRLRALPVVFHLLQEDIDWFSSDARLFEELKVLLRQRVVSATDDGDRDAEAPKTRKRARKEELCVQGERLQFTYRYRKTLPRYTVLSYAGENTEGPENSNGGGNSSSSRRKSAGSKLPKANSNSSRDGGGGDGGDPAFRHLPLSESTLLVWVYRFDKDDPYRSVPNEAALQFAPPTAKSVAATEHQQALDVEAIGRRSGAGARGMVGVQGGARDTGLLAWLWGGGRGDGGGSLGGGVGGGGGVRQHFIGSAAWQGPSGKDEQGREAEDEDIQRAIALSLAMESRTGSSGGIEESKG
ncbi:unnamed protein product [Hapterophycus canaliculatus]